MTNTAFDCAFFTISKVMCTDFMLSCSSVLTWRNLRAFFFAIINTKKVQMALLEVQIGVDILSENDMFCQG